MLNPKIQKQLERSAIAFSQVQNKLAFVRKASGELPSANMREVIADLEGTLEDLKQEFRLVVERVPLCMVADLRSNLSHYS